MADIKLLLLIWMSLSIYLEWPFIQSSLASFLHLRCYFQSPFICKHQFVLVPALKNKQRDEQKIKLKPSCSCSGAVLCVVLSLADRCGQNDLFFIAFSFKKFSVLCWDACDVEEEGSCLLALDWFTDQCVLKWQGGEHLLNQRSQALKNTTSVMAVCLFPHIFTHSLRGGDDREATP